MPKFDVMLKSGQITVQVSDSLYLFELDDAIEHELDRLIPDSKPHAFRMKDLISITRIEE